LSAKGFRLYHLPMADNAVHTIITGPAVPLTLTVQVDAGHWVLRAWYHGKTMADALNPQLVAERYFSKAQVPLEPTWRELWLHVALAVDELSTLSGGIVRTD
jgi:hypothetical protein